MSVRAEAYDYLLRVAAMLREALEARDWEQVRAARDLAEDRALRIRKGEA